VNPRARLKPLDLRARLKPLDLRARVTVASVLVLALGLGVLSLAINLLLANRLAADASRVLRERTTAQLATVQLRDGRPQLTRSIGDQALDQQGWVFAGGRELEHPPIGSRLDSRARAFAATARLPAEHSVGDVRLRAAALLDPVTHRRVGVVVVGVSVEPYERSQQLAALATLLLDVFVLLAVGLLARRAVGAALRPVKEMTERAADWSDRDLHRRFNMGPARDEITGLAATLDELLGRIDAVLRHEQRFSAEIAHELRTPLSGIRAEVELALRTGGAAADRTADDTRDTLERVLAAAQRMSAVIDSLLTAARSDAQPASGWSDPWPAIDELLESLQPAAAAHGVSLRRGSRALGDGYGGGGGEGRGGGDANGGGQGQGGRDGAGVPLALRVGVSAALLTRALHPLLENAIHHARSRVTLSAWLDGTQVVVRVLDDGPGVDAALLERIFEPGVSGGDGAGLGLALARRLARSADGEVSAVGSPAGGRFELRLPGGVRAQRVGSHAG
jgi:two-component system, OmpR family, sensor kinase